MATRADLGHRKFMHARPGPCVVGAWTTTAVLRRHQDSTALRGTGIVSRLLVFLLYLILHKEGQNRSKG